MGTVTPTILHTPTALVEGAKSLSKDLAKYQKPRLKLMAYTTCIRAMQGANSM